MAINCEIPTPSRKKYGYPENFIAKAKSFFGEPTNRASLRNIARKMGVDDTRTLSLKDKDGKFLFTKGLTEPTEWKSGKAVKKDIVVNVPSKTGSPQYFMSSTTTNVPPERWVISNGQVKPNPDWDAVGKNKTITSDGTPNLYIKDKQTGFYRLPRQGEQGEYLLNIQNPSRPLDNITNEKILHSNIDAIEHAPHTYELIHEPSQAMRAGAGDVYQKVPTSASDQQVFRTEVSEADTIKKLKELGVPAQVAGTIAGGVIGNMIDEESQFGGTFWGGALGFALTNGRFRTKMSGIYTKVKNGKDEFDEAAQTAYKMQKEKTIIERAHDVGFKGESLDEAQKHMDNVGYDIERSRLLGKSPKDGVFQNDWFQSLQDILGRLGIPQAKRLHTVFQGFGTVGSNTFAVLNNIQAKFGGKKKLWENITKKVQEFYPESQVTQERANEAITKAIRRIRTFGANIDAEGNFRYDESMVAARREYESGANVAFDRYVLETPELLDATKAFGEFFDYHLDDIVGTLSLNARRLVDEVIQGSDAKNLARQMFEEVFEQKNLISTGEYLDMNIEVAKAFNTFKNTDPAFKQFLDMTDDFVRFEEQRGRYVPQTMDREYMFSLRRDFLNDPTKYDPSYKGRAVSQMTDEEQEDLWTRYVSSRILENHKHKWKAMAHDTGGSRDVQYYSDLNAVKQRLEDIASQEQNAKVADTIAEDLARDNYGAYYKKVDKANGKSAYYLETPEKFKREGVNIFQSDNIEKLSTSFKNMEMRNLRYFSDHYDRPRNFIIPEEFLEIDIEKIAKHYSADIGPRIHNIRHKMYNEAEFEREWLNPISKELANKSTDAKYIGNLRNRVKSWYSTVQGIETDIKLADKGADPKEVQLWWQQKKLNEKVWNSVSKMSTAGFLYGVSHYALFQPAIMAPFFAGWKNTRKAYSLYARSPQALKRMTDELFANDTLRKTLSSLSPEFKSEVNREQLKDVMKPRHEKMFNTSDKMVDVAGNFSLAKPFLSKFGVDIENTGIARLLVGNMYDISGAEAGVFTMGIMRHVDDLAKAHLELAANKTLKAVDINGTSYSRQQLADEFAQYGVYNPDSFVKNKGDYDKYMKYLENEGQRPEMSNQYYQQITQIMNRSVDLYHARDKTIRPLKWMNNTFGQVFSRFATYSQNIAVNVSRGKIYTPMRDWHDRYTPLMKQDKQANFMKVAYWASTGNDKKFKQVFGEAWEDAYNEFPVQAVNNTFKVLGAIGIGHVMMMSRAAQMDLIGMATNEALGNDDYEAWRGLKRRVMYEDPETGEMVNVLDSLGDGIQLFDVMKALSSMLYMTTELGGFGKWGSIIANDMQFTEGGPASVFPAGSLATKAFETSGRLIHQTNIEDLPRQLARDVTDIGMNYTPIIGTYYDLRQGILNGLFKRPASRSVQYVDATDGQPLDIQAYEF